MTRPLPKSRAKSRRRAKLQHKTEQRNQGPELYRMGTKSATSSHKLVTGPI